MNKQKEMTARSTSVGADVRQSLNEPDNSITEKDGKINPLEVISMSELYDTVYQSRPPLIDGLLYPGIYLFVGAPKFGKSFLMAQLAYHVSTGTSLWEYPVKKSTVLYLALEDNYHRLQKRLYRMFDTECTGDLFFSISAGNLDSGLVDQLQGFMKDHPDTGLIIIDTLQKVREDDGDNCSYASDYQVIARLKALADRYGICMLIVHHTRKQEAEDKFDMISGTNGLLGAADGAFLLQKEKRTGNAATLEISGRDQPDQRLYLYRNPERLIWELEKAETELWKEPPEPLLEEISRHINTNLPGWQGTPTELVALLAVDMQPNALTKKLNVNAGRLFQEYGIRYENRRSHDGRRVSFQLVRA